MLNKILSEIWTEYRKTKNFRRAQKVLLMKKEIIIRNANVNKTLCYRQ